MTAKRKKQSICLETKYKIIQLLDKKTSYDKILKQFKDQIKDVSNISKIKSNRKKIVDAYESCFSLKAKRLRKSNYEDIEEGLMQFINKCSSLGIQLSKIMVREEAKKLAEMYGHKDFKSSNGFINKFKARNGVHFEEINGETKGHSQELCNEWFIKLPELVINYRDEDIFSVNELGLFWRILPNKIFLYRNKSFKCGRKSKERISVMVGSNKTGDEKLDLIVIGSAKEPRCFRNKQKLPLIYRNNENSWMTCDIFTQYLKDLNNNMIKQNRKIVIILNNSKSHPFIELSNIRLIFLPQITTSRLQPMSAGIIHTIKSKYRLKFCRKLLTLIDIKSDTIVSNINLYESLIMLKQAWDEISCETIQNCFSKCGLKCKTTENTTEADVKTDLYIWQQLKEQMDYKLSDFEQFVNFDNDLVNTDEISEDIEPNIITVNNVKVETPEEIANDDNENDIQLIDALNAINILRKYVSQNTGLENNVEILDNLEKNIYSSLMSFPLMANYFTDKS